MAPGPSPAQRPLGAVLAGGAGRRIGGDKAAVSLLGVPLVHWTVAAVREVVEEVVVVAKPDTVLPPLAGLADVLVEPAEPRHPVCGVLHALRQAGGRPVLAVAVDLPLLDGATLRALLGAPRAGLHAVVATAGGRRQPLCALYLPGALAELEGFAPDARLMEVVGSLAVGEVEVDPAALHNVNAPEDLWSASGLLSGRPGPRALPPRASASG
ncbi:MAG TPA: NTP transferase domain-containing protein [Baekduia sp.]|nr:NTP transferase domain-containing protein [Baekduia sp.]